MTNIDRSSREIEHSSRKESPRRSANFKMAALLSMALTLTACFEKAKAWSGDQLKALRDSDPKVERIETAKVEMFITTISNFNDAVEKGGSETIDMKDENDPEQAVYTATLVNKDTVLVEQMDPTIQKRNDASIHSADTVYKVVKHPKTGRVSLVIQLGNLLDGNDSKEDPNMEAAIDRDTGIVEYVTNNLPLGGGEGFSLEDDGNGNLKVREGDTYRKGLGQEFGKHAEQQLQDVAKALNTTADGQRDSGAQ